MQCSQFHLLSVETFDCRNPDGVMLCVLPENTVDDVTLHIHFTLIEAYCWENDIRVIKVRNFWRLSRVFD